MALTIIKAIKEKSAVSVKHMLHQRIAGWESPRSHETLHASDLMKDKEFCPREHAFLTMGIVKKKAEFIGTALRMTFDHGRDLEHRIRDNYLRDLVVGYWSCGVCGQQHPTFGKEPKVKCAKCGWGHQWRYVEPRFTSPYSGISGGLDLLLDVGEPKLRIVELKSMKDEDFKKLAAPLAEHNWRTRLYLRLADESDHHISERVNTKTAHILYCTKGFGTKEAFGNLKEEGIKDAPFSPFKEFVVTRDDAQSDVQVARARALHVWKQNPTAGLPCGICHNGLTKRAQGCLAVGACWSGQYPATISWTENGAVKHPGKKVFEGE